MKIDIQLVPEGDKPVLCQMLELYLHDFSEYDHADLNEHGYYGYRYLDTYWIEPGRYPFLIKADGKLAGFVLVNKHSYRTPDEDLHSIAEFFVLRKYRRLGIGKQVAVMIFERFPGKWEVNQHPDNLFSIQFWEDVISSYTNGNYELDQVTTEDWTGPSLTFNNAKT